MSQRTERIAGEVRAAVGEVIARQEIKDPRVRGSGLITVTHVRISGDLRLARVSFTVHGAGALELERVREGLDHASGVFRHAIGRRLRMKVTPQLSFEVDRVFDQASKVEQILRELAPPPPGPAVADASEDGDEQEGVDEQEGDNEQAGGEGEMDGKVAR